MIDFKQNKLRQILQKKREEKDKIKREFVDTGNADSMIAEIHKKGKPSIDIKSLPF